MNRNGPFSSNSCSTASSQRRAQIARFFVHGGTANVLEPSCLVRSESRARERRSLAFPEVAPNMPQGAFSGWNCGWLRSDPKVLKVVVGKLPDRWLRWNRRRRGNIVWMWSKSEAEFGEQLIPDLQCALKRAAA
jgi:hypothetical protein